VFPLYFLVDTLERVSLENKRLASDWTQGWLIRVLLDIGVNFALIFEVYNYIFDSKGGFWLQPEAQLHLLAVMHELLST
jgi:hypothetical protein